MLTTVPETMQPQFPAWLLTLVPMTTMQERLNAAMDYGNKTKADLARACKISRTAVSKWFTTGKNLQMEHLFAVADVCRVDARWLAIGQGEMKPSKGASCTHEDIPVHRFEMLRAYGRLEQEIRTPIKMLIETLDVSMRESAREHSQKMAKFTAEAKARDAKKKVKLKEVE